MKMVITVRGLTRECGFEFDGDVRDLQGYWDEGFDVAMVENEIPKHLPGGLVGLWMDVQDFFCKE